MKHHGLVGELDKFQVPVMTLVNFTKKGIAQAEQQQPALVDLVLDLKQHGYIRSPDSLSVSLTEKGLAEGLRGRWRRVWDFINRSPGLAILISFTSLLVAILSLFVAFKKLT